MLVVCRAGVQCVDSLGAGVCLNDEWERNQRSPKPVFLL